jgi:hypothetical protein
MFDAASAYQLCKSQILSERFDLFIDLPGGVWTNKPGGVEVSIRWPIAAFGDNLCLYVYKDGARIAKSDGVIASAKSVIILQAVNGLYNVAHLFWRPIVSSRPTAMP